MFTVLHSSNKLLALELIGAYDLDPNRVADIVITVFEKNTSDLSYLELLKALDSKVIKHVFGFKFLNTSEKCASLCEVAAHCIKAELLELNSL